jgi:hypothetical protein
MFFLAHRIFLNQNSFFKAFILLASLQLGFFAPVFAKDKVGKESWLKKNKLTVALGTACALSLGSAAYLFLKKSQL